MLLASPCWRDSVVVPFAPVHVTLNGDPVVMSNSVFVKWREVDEGFVPAANILNSDEVAVCPDVSSRRRTYVPAGVNAYGLHDRNWSEMPTKENQSIQVLLKFLDVLNVHAMSLTTVVPLNKVKLEVPTAPDQVTSNGAPAVRPFNDPVNARTAADLPIVNADKKHNCKANSRFEISFILKNEQRNMLTTRQTYELDRKNRDAIVEQHTKYGLWREAMFKLDGQ